MDLFTSCRVSVCCGPGSERGLSSCPNHQSKWKLHKHRTRQNTQHTQHTQMRSRKSKVTISTGGGIHQGGSPFVAHLPKGQQGKFSGSLPHSRDHSWWIEDWLLAGCRKLRSSNKTEIKNSSWLFGWNRKKRSTERVLSSTKSIPARGEPPSAWSRLSFSANLLAASSCSCSAKIMLSASSTWQTLLINLV